MPVYACAEGTRSAGQNLGRFAIAFSLHGRHPRDALAGRSRPRSGGCWKHVAPRGGPGQHDASLVACCGRSSSSRRQFPKHATAIAQPALSAGQDHGHTRRVYRNRERNCQPFAARDGTKRRTRRLALAPVFGGNKTKNKTALEMRFGRRRPLAPSIRSPLALFYRSVPKSASPRRIISFPTIAAIPRTSKRSPASTVTMSNS
jgi:hypothetical protein